MKINIPHLLLLPSNINSNVVKVNLDSLLNASFIFKKLYELEEEIKPIILTIEARGIDIDSKWLTDEIKRINQLFNTRLDLNNLMNILNEEKIHDNLNAEKVTSHLTPWVRSFVSKSVPQKVPKFTIKGEWNLYSSYSGRMTAKKMPLISMPKSMRKYVISSSSHKELWSIDLNQAELRFLAYFSKDQFLLDHFSTSHDVYLYISSLITKYNRNAKPEISRNICKTFLLAWLYGASRNTLMKKLRKKGFYVTTIDIQDLLSQLANRMLQAVHYLDTCSTSKEVRTFFGYAIPLVELRKSTKRNFGLQSSVATTIKLLMLEAQNLKLDIVHVIHDEIWIEVNPTYSKWQNHLQQNFNTTMNSYHKGFPLNNILNFKQLEEKRNG